MTNLQEIMNSASDLPIVESARIWKDKRVYINLYAQSRRFRGDCTYQLFYCADRGWVSQCGKGITSRDFDAALTEFELAMGVNA